MNRLRHPPDFNVMRPVKTHRGLTERVEEPMASRLRLIAQALLALRAEGRTSRLFINEIADAIDNGMLLAAMELSTTLLEIWIRDLLVVRKLTQAQCTTAKQLYLLFAKIDREIEGLSRGQMFRSMCRQLADLEVIDSDELRWLEETYEQIRTPLHHGISGRILDPDGQANDIVVNAATNAEALMAYIFGKAPHMRADQLESYVYATAPRLLEQITNFLAAHPLSRVQPMRRRKPPSADSSRTT